MKINEIFHIIWIKKKLKFSIGHSVYKVGDKIDGIYIIKKGNFKIKDKF